ncbi:MAG TPA: Gfo/Idh/MocA family oxidoreductase [Cytophagaceae bacterium]|jgi:virulence factor|nr:Gfo/Idh/MocA family oxidoreductase [Cytophagaceae bacterium]
MKKRIGIIGLGNIAQKVYLPILSKHTQVEIVGILSRNPETVNKLGELYRIANRFTDLNSLLDKKPDAVFVHSPTETHFEIVLQCLKKGVHVYVDKPFSYSIKESHGMVKTAEENKLLLCAGFNRRFAPLYLEAKNFMEQANGFTTCIAQKHRTKLQNLISRETLYDDMIHILDLLIWLNNGKFELADYRQQTNKDDRLLHASGTLHLNKAQGFFSMDRNAGHDLEKVELHGNGCSAEIINMEIAKFAKQKTDETIKSFGSWDDILYRRGFTGIVNHFLDSIDKPSECLITGKQVLATHELVEQLIRMSEPGFMELKD